MPPQAVTLEPLVQGECVVTVLRLLGRTEHAHQPWSATFLWYEISAQGLARLQTSQRNFVLAITLTQLTAKCYSNFDRLFAYATLLKQCLFDGLLKHANALLHAGSVVAGLRFS